jgi:hypothetical protein
MSLSQQDLWIGAAYLVSINRPDLMKPAQREALATFKPDAQLLAEVVSDVLPCPLCVGRRFTSPIRPFVFQGRWSSRWTMHSGDTGCPHADQKQFLAFAPTRQEVVARWNTWVKDVEATLMNFPSRPESGSTPEAPNQKVAAGGKGKKQPAQSRAG